MDLGAYAQIEDIEEIASRNGIEVPRLRGYRLMRDEKKMSLDEWVDIQNLEVDTARDLCESVPFWDPKSDMIQWADKSDKKIKKYIITTKKDGLVHYSGIRWNLIHGRKRRVLKTAIHNQLKRYQNSLYAWNKYAGRDDILYVHARIGGNNWPYYCNEVVGKSWFLEKVDDAFDSTYCDIYAKIDPNTIQK